MEDIDEIIGKDIAPMILIDDSPKHIMISYSWSQQSVALKLRNNLQKSGIKVWLDVDRMQVRYYNFLTFFPSSFRVLGKHPILRKSAMSNILIFVITI